jgi:hypothetical protein
MSIDSGGSCDVLLKPHMLIIRRHMTGPIRSNEQKASCTQWRSLADLPKTRQPLVHGGPARSGSQSLLDKNPRTRSLLKQNQQAYIPAARASMSRRQNRQRGLRQAVVTPHARISHLEWAEGLDQALRHKAPPPSPRRCWSLSAMWASRHPPPSRLSSLHQACGH